MDSKIIDIEEYLKKKLEKKKAIVASIFSESFMKMDAKLDELDESFCDKAIELLVQFDPKSPQSSLITSMMSNFQLLLLAARACSFGEEMTRVLLDKAVNRVAD